MFQTTFSKSILIPTLLIQTLLIVIVSVGNSARAQSGGTHANPSTKVSPRAQLAARIEPASVKAGSPITVLLSLKNGSRDTIRVQDTSVEQDYEILVVDGSGTEAMRTDLGKHLMQEEKHFRAILVLIKSGDEVEAAVDITKIYDLKEPKTYYVRVMRTLLPESDDKIDPRVVERVVSNPVAFTVVE